MLEWAGGGSRPSRQYRGDGTAARHTRENRDKGDTPGHGCTACSEGLHRSGAFSASPACFGGHRRALRTQQPGDGQETRFHTRAAIAPAPRLCVAQQVTGTEKIPKPELCNAGAHGTA